MCLSERKCVRESSVEVAFGIVEGGSERFLVCTHCCSCSYSISVRSLLSGPREGASSSREKRSPVLSNKKNETGGPNIFICQPEVFVPVLGIVSYRW